MRTISTGKVCVRLQLTFFMLLLCQSMAQYQWPFSDPMHVDLNFGAVETASGTPQDLVFHDHIDIYPSDPIFTKEEGPFIKAPTDVVRCDNEGFLVVFVEIAPGEATPSGDELNAFCADGRRLFGFGSVNAIKEIGERASAGENIARLAKIREQGLNHIELLTTTKEFIMSEEGEFGVNGALRTQNPLLLQWTGQEGVRNEAGTDPQNKAPKILRVIFWDRWKRNPVTGALEEIDCSFPGEDFTLSPCFVDQITAEELNGPITPVVEGDISGPIEIIVEAVDIQFDPENTDTEQCAGVPHEIKYQVEGAQVKTAQIKIRNPSDPDGWISFVRLDRWRSFRDVTPVEDFRKLTNTIYQPEFTQTVDTTDSEPNNDAITVGGQVVCQLNVVGAKRTYNRFFVITNQQADGKLNADSCFDTGVDVGKTSSVCTSGMHQRSNASQLGMTDLTPDGQYRLRLRVEDTMGDTAGHFEEKQILFTIKNKFQDVEMHELSQVCPGWSKVGDQLLVKASGPPGASVLVGVFDKKAIFGTSNPSVDDPLTINQDKNFVAMTEVALGQYEALIELSPAIDKTHKVPIEIVAGVTDQATDFTNPDNFAFSSPLHVASGPLRVENFQASPPFFDPDGAIASQRTSTITGILRGLTRCELGTATLSIFSEDDLQNPVRSVDRQALNFTSDLEFRFTWDGKNDAGVALPDGAYVAVLEVNGQKLGKTEVNIGFPFKVEAQGIEPTPEGAATKYRAGLLLLPLGWRESWIGGQAEIFTLNGVQIATVAITGTELAWDGRRNDGRIAGKGVYRVLLKDRFGNKVGDSFLGLLAVPDSFRPTISLLPLTSNQFEPFLSSTSCDQASGKDFSQEPMQVGKDQLYLCFQTPNTATRDEQGNLEIVPDQVVHCRFQPI